jgi:hypothetical protein
MFEDIDRLFKQMDEYQRFGNVKPKAGFGKPERRKLPANQKKTERCQLHQMQLSMAQLTEMTAAINKNCDSDRSASHQMKLP